jgi:tRNA A37 threonylcarbamoyladenosine synthetase subunit TsaC/SUA5/YrdC
VVNPGTTVEAAVEALLAGQPVILPTDTVYGVAVDPSRPGATERLFAIKERPTDVALPVLAADHEQALGLAGAVPDAARRLAERFWPGGLTLVLARHPGVTWDLGGADELGEGVAVVIDGGRCAGAPSTVVACLAGEVRVLRAGRIAASTIEEVVGRSVFRR